MGYSEIAFKEYSRQLVNSLSGKIELWILNAVKTKVPDLDPEKIDELNRIAVVAEAQILGKLEGILTLDAVDQFINPLAILREVYVFPTEFLASLGLVESVRDEYQRKYYPDDIYDLVPASFADFGPEVNGAGIAWGAAKAHEHLQNRVSES